MRDIVILVNIIFVFFLTYMFVYESANMREGLNFLIPLGLYTPPLLTLYYLIKKGR